MAAIAGAESPTSGTLRLADVFVSQPGRGGFVEGTARFDRGGAAVILPDTAAWRVPPAPVSVVATPDYSVLAGLPSISMPNLSEREPNAILSEPFRDGGQLFTSPDRTRALVEFDTTFTFIRSRYTFRWSGATGEHVPLVFFHGPQTTETFTVPEGAWELERRLWRAEAPDRVLTLVYKPQVLGGGSTYAFSTASDDEQELLERLRGLK